MLDLHQLIDQRLAEAGQAVKNNENDPGEKRFHEGRIEILLRGKKLKGAFALIRMRGVTGTKSQWLLIKMKDEYADARRNPVSSQPESVKTGKTIKDWKEKLKVMEKRKKYHNLKIGTALEL